MSREARRDIGLHLIEGLDRLDPPTPLHEARVPGFIVEQLDELRARCDELEAQRDQARRLAASVTEHDLELRRRIDELCQMLRPVLTHDRRAVISALRLILDQTDDSTVLSAAAQGEPS